MKCLGIDIGSSSIKAAILNLDRSSIEHSVSVAFPANIENLAPGHFEVGLAAILHRTKELLNQLLGLAPEVHAIFVSSQMGGVVVLDANGQPATNYLSWRDQRTLQSHVSGQSYFATARNAIDDTSLAELGNELKPGSTTSLLYWLQQKGHLTSGMMGVTLGALVVSQLTSQPPWVEHSEAIGVWDMRTGHWHLPAFEQLGLGKLRLPEVAQTDVPNGYYAFGGRHYPVYPAVGDHPCSLLGVDLAEGELSINVSTGSQVSRRTSQLCLGDWQIRYAIGSGYLNTITHLPAGRSLQVLVELVSQIGQVSSSEAWKKIVEAVEISSDSDLQVDLTFFDGPMGNSGSISGITLDNLTLGGLFRAAFKNMADNYVKCAKRLDPNLEFDTIVLSGGLTQRVPFLRKAIVDKLNSPVRECPEAEDVLLGLLRLAKQLFRVPRQV
jgi:sugar (pentulose or hexulose) kinase